MMWEWDKSNIFTNKYNEEISNLYNSLWKNQKVFDKFVSYIENIQTNCGEKQCIFDSIAGMETNYLVFNNEIEQLNSHVATAAGSLRRFSQLREGNQTNTEWNDLSKQINTLIELLNQFLINKSNITNNFAASSKCNQNNYISETSKINNCTQTERSSCSLHKVSKTFDERIQSEVVDLTVEHDCICNFDNPQGKGPIRRKRKRHSTSCCSCGKSKVANKSTQTKNIDSKKHQNTSCCICICKCCKDDSKDQKIEKDDGCWVTLYEVQTQTSGNEICPQTAFYQNETIEDGLNEPTCSGAENFIQKTEPPYIAAKKPTSSTISPTPYGVSSNSLPVDDKNYCSPMECNIKLLLKLLQEIEKSLNVVKQLHDNLLKQTGYTPTANSLDPNNNDINLHLTITLENNLPENGPKIELNEIQNNPKGTETLSTSGKRSSSFFKRKNGNLYIKPESIPRTTPDELQNNAENNSIKSQLEEAAGNTEKIDYNTSNNDSDAKSVPPVNIGSHINNGKSVPRDSVNSYRRPSFKQSLYEDDPNFTKCLLNKGPNCVPVKDNILKRSSIQKKNLNESDRDKEKSLPNSDGNLRKFTDGKSKRKSPFYRNAIEINLESSNSNKKSSDDQSAENKRATLIQSVFKNSDKNDPGIINNYKSDASKTETTNGQINISKPCRNCDGTKDKGFNQSFDSFRCPTCQHRCVYCKSCFEMHETLYNCLKDTKNGKCDQIIKPPNAPNANLNSQKDDKNFWAETMLYFMPNFLASMRKGAKPEHLITPTESNPTQFDQKNTVKSETTSPECKYKPKYKWVLIRVEYFEDGTRQINLIDDTDIPENSYLTASK